MQVWEAKEALSLKGVAKEALSPLNQAYLYWCGKRGTVSIESGLSLLVRQKRHCLH